MIVFDYFDIIYFVYFSCILMQIQIQICIDTGECAAADYTCPLL